MAVPLTGSRLAAAIRVRWPTGSQRPKPARRISPNLPDAQPRPFAFRIYETAVRDLRQPAISCRWIVSAFRAFREVA